MESGQPPKKNTEAFSEFERILGDMKKLQQQLEKIKNEMGDLGGDEEHPRDNVALLPDDALRARLDSLRKLMPKPFEPKFAKEWQTLADRDPEKYARYCEHREWEAKKRLNLLPRTSAIMRFFYRLRGRKHPRDELRNALKREIALCRWEARDVRQHETDWERFKLFDSWAELKRLEEEQNRRQILGIRVGRPRGEVTAPRAFGPTLAGS